MMGYDDGREAAGPQGSLLGRRMAASAEWNGPDYHGDTAAPLSGQLPQIAEGLANISARLSNIDSHVAGLLNRCHGPSPEGVGADGSDRTKAPGHFSEIARRFEAIYSQLDRLEQRTSALDTIG